MALPPPDIGPIKQQFEQMRRQEQDLVAVLDQTYRLVLPRTPQSVRAVLTDLKRRGDAHLATIREGIKRNEEAMGELLARYIQLEQEFQALRRTVSGEPDPLDHPDFAEIRESLRVLETGNTERVLRQAFTDTSNALRAEIRAKLLLARYFALLVIGPAGIVGVMFAARMMGYL